jgi:hypothetical protein
MQTEKQELVEKLNAKGLSMPQVAEAVGLEVTLLKLYLADDAFPVPTRIMNKIIDAAK